MQIEMIKIGSDGEQLPKDAPEWDAVLLPQFGLMFGATNVLPDDVPQEDVVAACKAVKLCGREDWDAPEIDELALLVRRDRHDPAIDTDFFRDIRSDWYWSKTQPAWDEKSASGSSPFAWLVGLSYGDVYYLSRNDRGFGLPVCRVGQ